MAADKELRKMRRTELVEIIYAMKNREEQLLREKEELLSQVQQEVLPIEEAGSVAEATSQLQRILDQAQKATAAYMDYLRTHEQPHTEDEG